MAHVIGYRTELRSRHGIPIEHGKQDYREEGQREEGQHDPFGGEHPPDEHEESDAGMDDLPAVHVDPFPLAKEHRDQRARDDAVDQDQSDDVLRLRACRLRIRG